MRADPRTVPVSSRVHRTIDHVKRDGVRPRGDIARRGPGPGTRARGGSRGWIPRGLATVALALVGLTLVPAARAAVEERPRAYQAEISLLSGLLRFDLSGTLTERIDRQRGRYEVRLDGQGRSIEAHVYSDGMLQGGRWTPLHSRTVFSVYGRRYETEIRFDPGERRVAYRSRGESFFMRRQRAADDVLSLPPDVLVDDMASATLNYADRVWRRAADGAYRTHVVRRSAEPQWREADARRAYRAELRPLVLQIAEDPASGRATGLFDITGFSAWARPGEPARIAFTPDRRLATIRLRLKLGSSVVVELRDAQAERVAERSRPRLDTRKPAGLE